MRVTSVAGDIIDRVDMKFLNDGRTCRFLKPVSQIPLYGMELGSFQQGAETKLPNWVIDVLLMNGILELTEEESVESKKRLRQLAYNEEHNTGLQTIPDILYSILRQKIRYYEGDKTSLDPEYHEEIQKLRESFRSLVASRMPKLIRAAWAEVEKSGTIQIMKSRMSAEERWLCEELVTVLSAWLRGVQGVRSSP